MPSERLLLGILGFDFGFFRGESGLVSHFGMSLNHVMGNLNSDTDRTFSAIIVGSLLHPLLNNF